MDDAEIQKCLGDCGKAFFVNRIDLVRAVANGNMTQVAAVGVLKNEERYTPASCQTRLKEALAIIRAGAVHQACQLIENSRVSDETKRRARAIRETMEEQP